MASTTNRAVDLNCDFGEGYGIYSFGQDAELLQYVTSVNIACGFHAGDPHTMRTAVKQAIAAGAAIGAHPGLPDRLGFGRREMLVTASDVYDFVLYQLGALQAFVRAAGGKLAHLKPHGALYHMANRDKPIAEAIVKAALAMDDQLIVYGQSGSLLLDTAKACGLPSASEVFADRAYEPDGSLASRGKHGAVLQDADEAAAQAVAMASQGTAFTPEGAPVKVQADTICLHGDGAHAALFASRIRKALVKAGITLQAPGRT
ncbi:LamB/YcsF family protein [Paenibacillus glycanilyticus]|uniref:LamB/YcsF family protein n=1 Tax=Paenibacillus glycanilyticus TaxID=126569 RepID=UPI002040DE1B|nr:5-oxoprolinase subunit PxpA [Paenibacillus glycanilyticus]MCM3628948.1 LamB/YcsF family protein [Paenibacillus glycanilyticus]